MMQSGVRNKTHRQSKNLLHLCFSEEEEEEEEPWASHPSGLEVHVSKNLDFSHFSHHHLTQYLSRVRGTFHPPSI